MPRNLPPPFGPLPRTGLGSKFALKLELIHQQVFNFVRYFFDSSQGLVKPKHERDPWGKRPTQAAHALNRPVDGHRKAGSVGTPSYETLTVGGQ